jgi:Tol biopolymer transport system component
MQELRQRFGTLDAIDAPDLWTDVVRPRPAPPVPEHPRRGRVVAIALAVAIAGLAMVFLAFRGDRGGAPEPAAPSVTNGVIAYVQDGEVWTVQPDGSQATRVHIDAPGGVGGLAWSPDGMRIAFDVTSYPAEGAPEGGYQDIFVANADGSGVEQLTHDRGNRLPAWSPDGSRIAYTYQGPDGSSQVFVMDANGSNAVQLTTGSAFNLRPQWSPDGTRIAFESIADRNADVYVMNADGSGATRLTSDPAADSSPVWSPDGTRIAFTSAREPSGMYLMNADGSDLRLLEPDADVANLGIAWSPDGSLIAFSSSRGGGSARAIYVLDPASGAVTQVTDRGAIWAPAWQPVTGDAQSSTPSATSSPTSTSGGRVTATIDVGDADAVTYGEGSIWVTRRDAPSLSGNVLRIDPTTSEVVATIPVDAVPQWETGGGGITVALGSVWVAGSVARPDGGTEAAAVQIDPATNTVLETIRLGGRAADDLAVGSDGSVWALLRTMSGQPEVVKLDASTHSVVASLQPLGGSYGRYIFASGGGALVDLAEPPAGPIDSSTMMAVDPSTGDLLATVWLRSLPYSATAMGDGEVWAATGTTLERLDLASGKTLGEPFEVTNTGDTLAVGEGRVWFVGPEDRGVLHGYDPAAGQVDVNVDLGAGVAATAMAVSPGAVWVLDFGGTLIRVDLG